MESSGLLPPVKSPIFTNSTTLHESNSNNSGNLASKRSKQPLPPLYIPPGHVAFRLLCHVSRIGGLIGKSGSIIKQLQQLTNSYIRVEDPPESSDNRVISVVSSPAIIKKIKLSAPTHEEENNGVGIVEDEEWFDVSAAQEGIVKVFERVVEGDAVAGIEGVVSCRLLVSKSQGGAVIGKGGIVVAKIRKDTGCKIKVLAVETISSASLRMDQVVEIEGLGLAVKKALVAITARLQEFPPVEKTRMHAARPLNSESFLVQTLDLPLQSNSMQPTSSNSFNHAWGSGPSLDSEKVINKNSTTQQQEVVFKILCPSELVGSIIGKGGSIIKALQNETGALISIGPTLEDCDERVITITAVECVDSEYSPAQKAAIAVFNRFMETGLLKGLDSDSKGSSALARVVVPSHQVGCLLGKGGAIISEMRRVTGTGLRIIGGSQLPKCASENNEVLQITGEFANVQDALYKVTSRLRDNIFSVPMLTGNGNRNTLKAENAAHGRARDHPPFGSHVSLGNSDDLNDYKYLTQSMDHLAIPSNKEQLPPPSVFKSVMGSWVDHGNNMATFGKLLSFKGGVELGSGSRCAMVTSTTVEIAVPDAVIGSIYGENGANLERLRQISGAKVVVVEEAARPGTTHTAVVISGTPDETQAAQSLLQAFILSGS